MNTLTPTPGPWKLERDLRGFLSLRGDDDTFIGDICHDQDEPSQVETANAILLAAAPDLLAALKEARDWNNADIQWLEALPPDLAMLKARRKALNTAISKAEGGLS